MTAVRVPRVHFVPASCHPERMKHVGELCALCYKKARRKKGGASVERERVQNAERHKEWVKKDPERARRKHVIAGKRWRAKNKEHLRFYSIKRKYGLSRADYEIRVKSQGDRCAICRRLFVHVSRIHIDHCHATGVVRGILCQACNHVLGAAEDAPAVLLHAIQYLKRWS